MIPSFAVAYHLLVTRIESIKGINSRNAVVMAIDLHDQISSSVVMFLLASVIYDAMFYKKLIELGG